MKYILVLLSVFGLSGILFAREAPGGAMALPGTNAGSLSIAVLPFQAVNMPESDAMGAAGILRSGMSSSSGARVVNEAETVGAIEQSRTGRSGCNDIQCIVSAGRLLAADRVITGSITREGDHYFVYTRCYDINSGALMFSHSLYALSSGEIGDTVRSIAGDLSLRLRGLPPRNISYDIVGDVWGQSFRPFYSGVFAIDRFGDRVSPWSSFSLEAVGVLIAIPKTVALLASLGMFYLASEDDSDAGNNSASNRTDDDMEVLLLGGVIFFGIYAAFSLVDGLFSWTVVRYYYHKLNRAGNIRSAGEGGLEYSFAVNIESRRVHGAGNSFLRDDYCSLGITGRL